MQSAPGMRPFCSFYVPKLMLVSGYVGVSAFMFLVHGRVPDRINVADAHSQNKEIFGP